MFTKLQDSKDAEAHHKLFKQIKMNKCYCIAVFQCNRGHSGSKHKYSKNRTRTSSKPPGLGAGSQNIET